MLNLGAEYVNLDAAQLSHRSAVWYGARAVQILEMAEGTLQNHFHIIDPLGDFLTGSAIYLNEIGKAVLSRSESRLIAPIENHFDQINEPNSIKLTLLHLSVGWPFGIEALLKSGANDVLET